MDALEIKRIREEYSLTQSQLAEITGSSLRAVQSWEQNTRNISQSAIKLINAFIEKSKGGGANTEEISKTKNNPFIRYWADVDVTGGGVVLFDDTLSDNYEDMLIPDFNDCTDAVNLYGDSMSPRYNSGQTIILKEWTDSFIAYGQVYLVITKSGFRTVKYLRKGANDNEVLCVSENKNYDPFPVNRDDIHKLYLVKGAIEKTTL